MLLVHGTEDAVVPVTQSRGMFAALRRAGYTPELLFGCSSGGHLVSLLATRATE